MERPVVDEAEVFLREEKSGGGGDPAPPAEEAKEDRREGGFIEPEAEVREGVLGVEVLGVNGPSPWFESSRALSETAVEDSVSEAAAEV
jgi:hypothetical protein